MASRRTSLARGGPALRELLELCRARLDSVSLRRELRAPLRRLVPFDAYCINAVDPLTALIVSSVGDGLSPVAARRLFELEAAGADFNALPTLARGPRHVATIASATFGDVARCQRMRELFVPLGFRDELRAALVVDGHCWGYLHLFRAGAPFDADELASVEQARSPFAAALRASHVVGRERGALRAPATLLFDRAGRACGRGPTAVGWLSGFAGDVGGEMPHALLASMTRVHVDELPANGRYRAPRQGWMSLHGSAVDQHVAVTLGAPAARELAPLWFLAHRLSAREREVAERLLDGDSNEAISASLGASIHTVKDHVKAIFEKTGVSGRVDLLAALQS